MNTDQQQRIALVTGAAGGIGRACVERLSAEGWQVAVVSRQAARLAEAFGPNHLQVEADVATEAGARQALAACTERLGAPTALVHAAGSTLILPAHRTSFAQWRDVIGANLDSAFLVLAAWAEAMRAQGRPGAAVLFSSVVSRIGVANHEAIAAAKGGVEALARSFAATYAANGLRANVVAPGLTETPMTAAMLRSEQVREAAGRQYPLGGVSQADEVAAAACWLVSPQAGRVTGQVLPVDGGFTAVRPLVR